MADENWRSVLEQDGFANSAGITIDEVAGGGAVCSVQLGPQHKNGRGTAQGGLIFTLADYTFAVAANSVQAPTVTLSSSIQFMDAPVGGRLTARAVPVGGGTRCTACRCTARTVCRRPRPPSPAMCCTRRKNNFLICVIYNNFIALYY